VRASERNDDTEAGEPLGLGLHLDRAPVQLHQLLGQRQPDPDTSLSPPIRRIDLEEPLEHPREVLGGDARARVLDLDADPRLQIRNPDLDPATDRGELDGVADEIGDHHLQPVRVSPDLPLGRLGREREVDRLGERCRLAVLVHRRDHRADVHLGQVEPQPPRVETGQIEKIIDQAQQAFRVTPDHPELLRLMGLIHSARKLLHWRQNQC
jgi:hypothetical protein